MSSTQAELFSGDVHPASQMQLYLGWRNDKSVNQGHQENEQEKPLKISPSPQLLLLQRLFP